MTFITRALLALSLFMIIRDINAQCEEVSGGLNCNGSPIICNIDTLDNVCFTMNSQPNSQGPTPFLCPTGGIANNIIWYSFVAQSSPVSVTIMADSCNYVTQMDGTVTSGIQTGIYEDCDFENALFCNPDCEDFTEGVPPTPHSETLEIPDIPVEIGEIYHIFIDGCAGSVCNIEITVTGGGGDPSLDPPQTINGEDDNGLIRFCRSSDPRDLVANLSNKADAEYIFTMPDGTVLNNGTNNVTDWVFDVAGNFEVCFTTQYVCDSTNSTLCVPVEIFQEPDETSDEVVLCEGESATVPGGYTLNGGAITVTEDDAPEATIADVLNPDGCLIDLTVPIQLLEENDENPTVIDTALCPDQLPFLLPDGTAINSCTTQDLVIMTPQGCDSFLMYDITVLDGSLIQLGDVVCTNGTYTVNADFQEADPACNDAMIDYQWLDDNGDPIAGADEPTLNTPVNPDGENFSLTATITLGGTSCDIDPLNVFIDPANFLPPDPSPIDGPTEVCVGETGVFSVGSLGGDVFNYDWTSTPGATITGGLSTNEITVLFETEQIAQICLVAASNDCGSFVGDPVCIDVTVVGPPPVEAGPQQQVCGDSTRLEAELNGDNGTWTVLDRPDPTANVIFEDINDPMTDVSVDLFGSYVFQWEDGFGDCSAADQVVVVFTEPLSFIDLSTPCQGGVSYIIQFTVEGGLPPYSLDMGNGTLDPNTGLFQSDPITSGTPYSIVISDGSACPPLEIEGLGVNCECDTEAGIMDTVELMVCEDMTVQGDTLQSPVSDGDDITLWVLHDNPGVTLGNILDSNQTGEFSFIPATMTTGTPYYISLIIATDTTGNGDIDFNDPCRGVPVGQEVIWYAYPTSNAGVDTGTCDMVIQLDAVRSIGAGEWTILSGPSGALISDSSEAQADLMAAEPGIYELLWVENNNGCTDSSTVSIEFYDNPEVALLSTECNESADSFVVDIEIVGGQGPYVLMPGNISFNDLYTSDPIPRDTLVDFTITDANGCILEIFDVTDACVCESQVGSMGTDTLEFCDGEQSMPIYDSNGEFYDSDDTTNFVLHTSSGNSLGTPIMMSIDGQFAFDPGAMNYGEVYYISAVVGDDFTGTGVVNLNDGCLAVAAGQPVVWYENPVSMVSATVSTCDPNFSLIAPDPAVGEGTWTFIDGPQTPTIVDPSSPTSALTDAEAIGSYRFQWTLNNNGCTDSDTLEVILLDAPTVDLNSLVFQCNGTNTEYTVSFSISNGDSDSYAVESSAGGSLAGNNYTTDEINSTESVSLVIYDDNGCDTVRIDTSFTCPCVTTVGTMASDQLEYCEDENAIGMYMSGGEVTDDDDVLQFYLAEEQGIPLNTILDVNSVPEFAFDPATMNYEQVYYIVPVLGSDVGGGEVDTSSMACFDIGTGQAVLWYEIPTAVISSSTTELTCDEPELELSAANSVPQGNLTYSWTASNGGVITGPQDQETATATAAGTYTLEVTNGECVNSTSIEITFNGELPTASAGENQTLTCAVTSVELDGSGSDSGADIEYSWTNENGDVISTDITATVTEPGFYTIRVLDNSTGCPATDQVQVDIDTTSPSIVITDVGELTCETEETTIDASGSQSGAGFEILWTTNNGLILSGETTLSPMVGQAGQYTLTITDLSNGCSASRTVTVMEIGNTMTNFSVSTQDITCFGDRDGQVSISVNGGAEPLQYSIDNGASFQADPVFNNLPEGDYEVLVRDAIGCTLGDQVSIVEPELVELSLPPDTTLELGDSYVIIPETNLNAASSDFSWTSSDTSFVCVDPNCGSISVNPIIPTTYQLTVTDDNGCSAFASTFVRVQVNRNVYIPNAFSPNNDGVNDIFGVYGQETVELVNVFQVYNRWGELVFQANNFEPNAVGEFGWDGIFKGEQAPPGVYVYYAQVQFRDGFQLDLTGDVTLVR